MKSSTLRPDILWSFAMTISNTPTHTHARTHTHTHAPTLLTPVTVQCSAGLTVTTEVHTE